MPKIIDINGLEKKIDNTLYYRSKNVLYHYTSPEGLLGILKNRKIWFTESSCLNDESEGKYIYEILRENLETGIYDQKFVELVYSWVLDNNLDKEKESNYLGEKFLYLICSFSTDNDALPLWNYYTKTPSSLGYNIAFSPMKLDFAIGNKWGDSLSGYYFYKVIYNREIQRKIVSDLLNLANKIWEDNNVSFIACENVVQWLRYTFERIRYGFKHPAFESEKEVRIILKMQEQVFNSILTKKDFASDHEIDIRAMKGLYMPYVQVEFDTDTVRNIMVSPTVKDKAAIESVSLLLKKYGYSRCRTNKSKIPLKY